LRRGEGEETNCLNLLREGYFDWFIMTNSFGNLDTFHNVKVATSVGWVSTFEHTNWFWYWMFFKYLIPTW
jgi:hypothetical protein